jgi:hypothetical protein
MGLDEQIDSLFERALFVMQVNHEDSSEIQTEYSASPMDFKSKDYSEEM